LTSDNSIQGSKDDIEKHMGLDYGSFGLPLSVEKANDQVNNFLKTIHTILCLFVKITILKLIIHLFSSC